MVRKLLKQDDELLDELADLLQPSAEVQPVKKVKLTAAQVKALIEHGTIGGK
jgi:hypothetical protein